MKSLVRLLILKLLEEKGRSGYSIIKEVEKRCGFKLSTGSVYPILEGLLKTGDVNFINKDRKKVYYLSELGKNKITKISDSKERLCKGLINHVKTIQLICGFDNNEIKRRIEKL